MTDKKPDTTQIFLNGTIQGLIIAGELFILKEMGGPYFKNPVGRTMSLVGATGISAFAMHWLKKQSFYPDV